jgi:hypothetical protein
MLTAAVDKLPEIKPAKVVQLEPKTGRTGAKRIKIYYGPFKLLGANVSFHNIQSLLVNHTTIADRMQD